MCEEGPAALAGGLRFCPLVLEGILTGGEIPRFIFPARRPQQVAARLPAGAQAARGCSGAFRRRAAPRPGRCVPAGVCFA